MGAKSESGVLINDKKADATCNSGGHKSLNIALKKYNTDHLDRPRCGRGTGTGAYLWGRRFS